MLVHIFSLLLFFRKGGPGVLKHTVLPCLSTGFPLFKYYILTECLDLFLNTEKCVTHTPPRVPSFAVLYGTLMRELTWR